MRFQGRVWRHIPAGAHPLDFSALINAGGRWNRIGMYGCLYTALSPVGAAAEYRKHFVRRGLRRDRDIVCLEVTVEYVLDVGAISSPGTTRPMVLFPNAGSLGIGPFQVPAPQVNLNWLIGDTPADLDHCRTIADWARGHGYLALQTPSAAMTGEFTLPIYPENRPHELQITVASGPVAMNYGPDPYVSDQGNPRRSIP